MAFDSNRNYAQEINDLIAAGGDPAEVNRLLNERLEKQQATNSEYSTYDDVYRGAMDYLAKNNHAPQASVNVDYAQIANEILLDQGNRGVTADTMADRSWGDLGTVVSARQQKLNTGEYDKWARSKIPETDIKYNGGGTSLDSWLQAEQELGYQQLRDIYGQGQGKVVMTPTGYVGSGAAIGWSNDADRNMDAGEWLAFQRQREAAGAGSGASLGSGYTGGTTAGSAAGGGYGDNGGYAGGTLGYTEEAWEKKQNRENAEAAVGVTDAATRVPTNGENNSYHAATTEKAFEAALQALLESGDTEGAQALKSAWDSYNNTGLVDIIMPGVKQDRPANTPVYGVYGGSASVGASGTGGTPVGGTATVIADPNDPNLNTAYKNRAMGASNPYYYELTDAQKEVLRQLDVENNHDALTYAAAVLDQSSVGSQTGDTAQKIAAQIVGGGGGVNKNRVPDAEISPIKTDTGSLTAEPYKDAAQILGGGQDTTMYYLDTTAEPYEVTAQRKDAAYRQAYSQAAARGDASAMSAVMAEWNAWKQSIRRQLTETQIAALGW